MENFDVISIVKTQLAKKFNCSEKDFDCGKLVVTEHPEDTGAAMRAVCFGGSAVFCVKPSMVSDFKRIFEGKDPDWIFETNSLIMLSEILYLHGHNVDNIYEYYVPNPAFSKTEPKFETEIIKSGFDRFKGEPLAAEVFDLQSHGPISIMAAAKKNGKIIGMAAAFAENDFMWQISLAVAPEERFGFAGENLLAVIKDAVLAEGKIPFYGGRENRISPSTGSAAGFFPCWSQILSRPRDDEFLNLHGTR
ncbi:MAG: hypothetical protein IJM98_09920 [Oscillospiraceae bacterium]|nr:hypothetical protein [Oscillospiraceae bacterium]MBQ6700960.1 hypothetical protein [Oscillospiraceae bacterium]